MLHHPPQLFLVSALVLWLSVRLGVLLKRWRPLDVEERDDFNIVLGATLTLLALIVGFTFSMAVSRYDQRKNDEEAEANAIGTEYLRVQLLPADLTAKAHTLLRQYTEARILFYQEREDASLAPIGMRTAQLQGELWSIVQSAAAAQPTPIVSLSAAGMNDVLNSDDYTQAAWDNRIPEGAWMLMTMIAIFSCALMGYGAHARPLLFSILPLMLSIAFMLIADIDAPRHGLIRVQPENLRRLAASLSGQ